MHNKNIQGQEIPKNKKKKRIKAGMILAITVILVLLIMILIIFIMAFTAKSPEESRRSKDNKADEELEESMSFDKEESHSSEYLEESSDSTASEEASSSTASTSEGSSMGSSSQESSSSEVPAQSQYILPESNFRYLTMEDLEGLTKEECRIARNELFARHGRLFTDPELQAYFDSLDWYHGTILPNEFSETVFNEYELANRDLIIKYEQEHGYR